MFKKLLSLSAIMAANIISVVYAGNLYFAPSLYLQDNFASSSSYRGLQPSISVGYSEMFPDFYLGGEVFGSPSSAILTNNHTNSVSARSTWSIGASIIPGMMVTDNMLAFARAGIVDTQFSSPNSTRAGGQIGVGLQTCLTPYWDFRAEYIYTAYKTVPTLGSVKTDQVGIGFLYKVIG